MNSELRSPQTASCFLPTAFEVPQVPRQAGATSERDLRYACFLPAIALVVTES